MRKFLKFTAYTPGAQHRLFTAWQSAIYLLMLSVLLHACKKGMRSDQQGSNLFSAPSGLNHQDVNFNHVSANMVLIWNNAATVAVAQMAQFTGSGPLPPMPESRIYAMVNVAMHDALNTIDPEYKRYALTDPVKKSASPDAAVAQAAHDVIVGLLPPQTGYADALLVNSLSTVSNGNEKTEGINIGKAAALAMLAKRLNDGVATCQFSLPQGTLPGEYRSTAPFDGPPFNGFMAVPGWGNIIPFSLLSGDAFRPEPPYPVNSQMYTTDYNEVKSLGKSNSIFRTPDQTQIALFWRENAPRGWNRIARNLSIQHNFNAWETARLLALLQMAEADANIAALNAKYHFMYWRPITAIHLGGSDDNNDTQGDPTWEVLAPPTPPVSDYPSNHAVNGGAAAELIEEYFHHDRISFSASSSSLPNITRSFNSLSEAEHENSLSRIYIGYHFRHAVEAGEKQGEKIGLYVYNHALQPNDVEEH